MPSHTRLDRLRRELDRTTLLAALRRIPHASVGDLSTLLGHWDHVLDEITLLDLLGDEPLSPATRAPLRTHCSR
jgi:hypothetical protein